ncbi:hypothetical protein B0A55_05804 [Friedmanniomyces simplex]|uniref:Uncharacterized protein n=1 Tax=Friedmanniomyces simplex TaxID=329884 RepID=A0A4U0XL35_9PEZI|nr:hypothetical protein B0A55_05804 [Friedmanniomyces simplex]
MAVKHMPPKKAGPPIGRRTTGCLHLKSSRKQSLKRSGAALAGHVAKKPRSEKSSSTNVEPGAQELRRSMRLKQAGDLGSAVAEPSGQGAEPTTSTSAVEPMR